MIPMPFAEFENQARRLNYAGFCTLSGGVVACDIESVISVVKQDMDRRAFTPNHKFQPLYVQFNWDGPRQLLMIGCDKTFPGYREVVP